MTNPFATAGMAAGYAVARPAVHGRVLDSYFATRERPRAVRALDLGCGAGLSTRALGPFVGRATGIEPVRGMLHYARDVAPHARFAAAVGEALPFRDASVDLVTAAGSLNYALDFERCCRELRRVLVPAGRLLVYDFSAGRRFADGSGLEQWFAWFLARYPYPASEARPLDPEILQMSATGFVVTGSDAVAVSLSMSRDAYETYVLTETNVASALRSGTALEEIRGWVHESLSGIWDATPRNVVFAGYWTELTPSS